MPAKRTKRLHASIATIALAVSLLAVSTSSQASNDATPAVPNHSFETPPTGSWIYNPANSAWTFAGTSGVTTNGSPFTAGNPPAPHGSQVALLQQTGAISQQLQGWKAGTQYRVTFRAAQRANASSGGQTWDVRLDNQLIASFAPPETDTQYRKFSANFTVGATGAHTLRFVGTNLNGGDNTVFIDSVAVYPTPTSWPQYTGSPFEIDLAFPIPSAWPSRGGVFVHELTGDGLLDYIVTAPGHIAAYDHNGGAPLWSHTDDIRFPGDRDAFTPGAAAADIDGNGQAEVYYLTADSRLVIRNGATGAKVAGSDRVFANAQFATPANFRGLGDRDALLQFGNANHLLAIAVASGATIWETFDWVPMEHSPVRVADVFYADGLDEVVGANIFGAHGGKVNPWTPNFNTDRLDSLALGDIIPGGWIETALSEQDPDIQPPLERGSTIVHNQSQIVGKIERADVPDTPGQCWREKDPDKLAVGDFDTSRHGLEVFARSACAHHPWVMDFINKTIIAKWNVANTAPAGWDINGPEPDEGGIDLVRPITWNPSGPEKVMVKERAAVGMAAIVNPMTGAFEHVFPTNDVVKTYVADVSGDYREEVILVEGNTGAGGNGKIKVFWNTQSNPDPNAQPRKWADPLYGRVKQNYNYYSP